jgi:hypothetical protein
MKYMVEFPFPADQREPILRRFEERGPNRNPGVKFRDAWIGERDHVIYVLVESDDIAAVESACCSWADMGPAKITPVVGVEQL